MQLCVKNLTVSYGNICALHGISFTVNQGEIVTVIGANGAGKSTTLRAISRMIPAEPDSTIDFMGHNILKYIPLLGSLFMSLYLQMSLIMS